MRTDYDRALFYIGLGGIPGVGRTAFRKLVERFGSPERALAASKDDLLSIDGLYEKAAEGIVTFPWRELAGREIEKARKSGVAIITHDEPAYPENLRNAPDSPIYLYVKGDLLPEDAKAIAIVGTRKPTHYGLAATYRIAHGLAAAGITVVSGMARGIDTQAHKDALTAKGRTIAVLGSGIDVPYPYENRALMEEIGRSGAVVSENPFGTKPEPGYFPARNRIISGLSIGTVIIEAAEDSGSLITADYALKQGRRLFAVPGNIGSATSKGPHGLIKNGALLVESADDILRCLKIKGRGAEQAEKRRLPPLTEDEETVLRCISGDPKHIDGIMSESGATPGKVSGVLVNLELKGVVRQLPGKYFVREE